MTLHEYTLNAHMHTPYSDGEWYHAQIAEAALAAKLDVIYVTDHNVLVQGPERYYEKNGQRLLMLIGEEIHDAARQPQKNHLLVYGHTRELARCAPHPQALIDAARADNALTFIAHPFDSSVPIIHYENISWVNWEVSGYTGLEIWNYMSDWARHLTTQARIIRYALNPELAVDGPSAATLTKWDELTTSGLRIVGLGNSDAHGTPYSRWGIARIIFPYEFLFRQVNTHLLSDTPFTGDYDHDRAVVLEALRAGHCFIGYDGAGDTRGFRFTASGQKGVALMGDAVDNRLGTTLQIVLPPVARTKARVRLLRNGQVLWQKEDQPHYSHMVPQAEPGVYRVEVHRHYQGRWRGWIYSNPIYVTE